jgi:nucleoside-diphosphate-sugar epimerase
LLFSGRRAWSGREFCECLLDADVHSVLSIGRSATGQRHAKLRELVHNDLLDFSAIEREMSGFDACFFCLGVTSAGTTEDEYRRVTYDITMAAAQTLLKLNPDMTFIYVSGAGTDSTESGRTMWARVKGTTENALLRLPFKAAYMFRPGAIQPLHGITSKTRVYRVAYALTKPLLPLLLRFPKFMTTTEQIGRAMLRIARQGYSKRVLESEDINSV